MRSGPIALVAELELERGQDRDQVGVAAALAVAVHRALHHARALLDRDQRVGHAAAGVVVGVDADLHAIAQLGDHARGGLGDLRRQRRAVGVAERDVLGARLGRGAQAAQRVVGVVAEGVEEVLGVVDHALALRDAGRRPSRRSCAGSPRGRPASPSPGAATRSCRPACRPARSSRPAGAGPGRRPRSTSLRRVMPKAAISACSNRSRASRSNSSSSLGFERGKARLDHVDAELVERVRDAHLLVHGQRHALPLHAVAEGGVVDEDLLSHVVNAFRDGNERAVAGGLGRPPA